MSEVTNEKQNHCSPGFELYATFFSFDFAKALLKLLSPWLGKWWVAYCINTQINLPPNHCPTDGIYTLSQHFHCCPYLLVGSRKVTLACDDWPFISFSLKRVSCWTRASEQAKELLQEKVNSPPLLSDSIFQTGKWRICLESLHSKQCILKFFLTVLPAGGY